jgi:2,3-bisphosphoglycerate-dependent phosphoglycerate mutase
MSHNTASGETPTICDWRLNERHYGDLQGLDKDETRAKFGAEQVHIWRRSYDIPPPGGESLETCAERTIPVLEELIIPYLEAGKTILVAAHGNSLRSIVMHIEGLSREEVLSLEIATGVPRSYEYDNGNFTRT